MKIAFISDIHSNLPALEKVLEEIERNKVDKILCCGDIVGYNAFPEECLKEIEHRKIESVMGNHDYAVLTGDTEYFNEYARIAVEWTSRVMNVLPLRKLRLTIEVGLDSKRFLIAHGSPRSIDEYIFPSTSELYLENLLEKSYDYIVLGHTHVPMKIKTRKGVFLNPGSVCQPRDRDPRASFMIFDTSNAKIELIRVRYDIDKIAESNRKAGLPKFLSERLYYGY